MVPSALTSISTVAAGPVDAMTVLKQRMPSPATTRPFQGLLVKVTVAGAAPEQTSGRPVAGLGKGSLPTPEEITAWQARATPTVSEMTAEAAARDLAFNRFGTREENRMAKIPATTNTSTRVNPWFPRLYRFWSDNRIKNLERTVSVFIWFECWRGRLNDKK